MTDRPDEPLKAWERQPWDTPASYAAFRAYLAQPRKKRSVSAAYRDDLLKSGKSAVRKNGDPLQASNTWRVWSAGADRNGHKPVGSVFEHSLSWAERAAAWDDEQDQEWERQWHDRRKATRDREYEVSQKLLQRAETMLAATLFRRTIESANGKDITTIEPTEWGERDILGAFKLGIDLARRASEMETARVRVVDWKDELLQAGINPDSAYQKLVDAMAEELAKGAA